MRSRDVARLVAVVLVAAACGGEASSPSTFAPTSVPPTTATTTTTFPDIGPVCEPPSFIPTRLPERVVTQPVEAAGFQSDQYTRVAGTAVAVWVDAEESPVVAFIRGALPPEQWTGEVTRIEIHGVDAAVGPLSNDVWAAAWFEGPDRCDEYTIIVYPPTTREQVVEVASSLSS